MFKMVIQAVFLSAISLGFILFQSDGLRQAANTGDFTKLVSADVPMDLGALSGGGGHQDYASLAHDGGANAAPWYAKLDPRKLWKERPQIAKFNTKTIKVPEHQKSADPEAQLAAQELDPNVVKVVKLK